MTLCPGHGHVQHVSHVALSLSCPSGTLPRTRGLASACRPGQVQRFWRLGYSERLWFFLSLELTEAVAGWRLMGLMSVSSCLRDQGGPRGEGDGVAGPWGGGQALDTY